MNIVPKEIAVTPRWVVVCKPPGWLSVPGRSLESKPHTPFPVLSDWASQTFGRVWAVHRLDRETSGVLLFARSAKDHAEANEWFRNRKVRKHYVFLAHGTPGIPILKLKFPVEEKPSTTQIEVQEAFPGRSAFFGRATPLTGRRHQIRIHLSQAGYPILGDPLYGGKIHIDGLTIGRVALHAQSLDLPTGELFQSSLPEDFQEWLKNLRGTSK